MTINHITSERSKLALKEFKTRHDWVGKVINGKLCKKLKFDHTNKQYMHKPVFILKNETHKRLSDFEMQSDPQISTRRPDLVIVNKKREPVE